MWQNIGGGGHQFLMNAYRGGGSFTFHIFVCLENGGCYFSHPDGEVMHFYHLGIGGVSIFFLTPRRCLPPPPPLKFMKSPLV